MAPERPQRRQLSDRRSPERAVVGQRERKMRKPLTDSQKGKIVNWALKQIEARKLLVICSSCGAVKIGKEKYYNVGVTKEQWSKMYNNISHGICRRCVKELYPDLPMNAK